jgi:hypothetical protein
VDGSLAEMEQARQIAQSPPSMDPQKWKTVQGRETTLGFLLSAFLQFTILKIIFFFFLSQIAK